MGTPEQMRLGSHGTGSSLPGLLWSMCPWSWVEDGRAFDSKVVTNFLLTILVFDTFLWRGSFLAVLIERQI